MALAFSELQSVSHNYFDPNIYNEVYEESPFFAKLKQKNKINYDGGIQLQFAIHYQQLGTGKAQGPREQILFESKDTKTAGVLPWTYYTAKTMIEWDEEVQNAGKGRIIDLARDKAKELSRELLYKLSYDAITATTQGTNAMVPLDDIIDSTATYAGIAYTDASEWAAKEDASTTTMALYGSGSLSYTFNLATFGTGKPTIFLTTRNLLSKYESILQPQVRYQSDDALDKKFPHCMFNGGPIFSDAFMPAGAFYGIDLDKYELMVKENQDVVTDWFSLEQDGRPFTKAKVAAWVGNMVCHQRKTSFKYTALDYTK